MSTANILHKLAGARSAVVEKTVTATLTAADMQEGAIKANHGSTQINLTLPAANTCKGYSQIIYDAGAAVLTVIAPDGFGGSGAGGSHDTLTLAQGEFCMVWSDGTQWHQLHNEPAG